MIKNKFGEQIYTQDDVCDMLMQGHDLAVFNGMLVDQIDLESMAHVLENVPEFVEYSKVCQEELDQQDYDRRCQSTWHMPMEYQQLDIAAHVLALCNTDAELQRAGEELLLFQERDLFDLLRYLKYLVDVMTQNHVIWGVGRGSSVASYVLYLLGVHRINSMYYDLDPHEFLR
jgi:DNA polymerase III alpha subunit